MNTNFNCFSQSLSNISLFSALAFTQEWRSFLSHFTCSESPASGQLRAHSLINPISSLLPQVHPCLCVCANSPRPENKKRNWQVKGALKVCGAAQKCLILLFFSIAPWYKEHVWSKLGGMVKIKKQYVFVPHVCCIPFSGCYITTYV